MKNTIFSFILLIVVLNGFTTKLIPALPKPDKFLSGYYGTNLSSSEKDFLFAETLVQDNYETTDNQTSIEPNGLSRVVILIAPLITILILVFFIVRFKRKSSTDDFGKFKMRLQPGKNDLMINNQYGIPIADMDPQEAATKGFVKWNYRWVTQVELQTLKPQYRTYKRIRWISVIIYCLGTWAIIRAGERYQSFPTNLRETVTVLSLFIYPVFHFVVGYNIQKYKNWARWVTVILYPLLIPPRYFYAGQTEDIAQWRIAVLLFFVFILLTVFSKTGRVIFSSGRVSVTRKKEDQSKTDSYNHSYEPQQPAISLVQAVCSGDIEEVARSIPGVISLEERDDQGGTPLIIAAHKGYTNIVELLLDNGADIDAWEYNTGKTALIYAIEKDRFKTAELLILRGANLNQSDTKGNTALMFATPETAEMLIKNGADVNLANCFGYTPLRFFREHGNEKIVAILEKAGSPDTDDIKTDNFSGNSQTSPAFTIEEIEEIRNLAKEGKIEAIKRVRQLKGWDLKEAKNYVDMLLNNNTCW
jgi:hypothetical protein